MFRIILLIRGKFIFNHQVASKKKSQLLEAAEEIKIDAAHNTSERKIEIDVSGNEEKISSHVPCRRNFSSSTGRRGKFHRNKKFIFFLARMNDDKNPPF